MRVHTAKVSVSWSRSFHDGEIVTGTVRASTTWGSCLYFWAEPNDSASSVVEAPQERKPEIPSMSHTSAETPMWESWPSVLQTRKRGEGMSLQDFSRSPSILQTIPLWSAISEVAWDTCKGAAIWRTTPPWHPRGWGAQSKGLEMDTRASGMSPSLVLLGESHLCLVGPRSGQFKTGADWTTKPAPVLGLLLSTVTPQRVFAWNQWKSIHWLASRPRKYMEDGGVCCNKLQRFQMLARHS